MPKLIQNKYIFPSIVFILTIAYAYLTLNSPVSKITPPVFQISPIYTIILRLSFVILLGLAWFFGSIAARRGIMFARETKEQDLQKFLFNLSVGFTILLLGYVIATFVGQIRTYHPDDPIIARNVTIIVNYIYVCVQLFGFWFIYKGIEKKVSNHNKNIIVGSVITIIIGVLWIGLIFTNPTRQISQTSHILPSYYISDFLIIYTIILPIIIGWFFGIMASFDLADLSVESANLSIQKSFSKLVSGVWLLILSYIVLFGILSVGAQRLLAVGLTGILFIIYVFIFIILLSYIYVGKSLKNLQNYKEQNLHIYESNK